MQVQPVNAMPLCVALREPLTVPTVVAGHRTHIDTAGSPNK